MGQNIKKKTAHNIYYGVDRKTRVLRHISDVPSGAKCACNCIACGKPLEARKGSVRKHHFAHESNYECMYAAEVAVYKAAADVITKLGHLALPPISISFPAWRKDELLKDAQIIEPDQVLFECSPLQYPPMFMVILQDSKLRLLFEFGAYYSEEDLRSLLHEAEAENYSLLLYHFPLISEDSFFAPNNLKNIFQNTYANAKWIRSVLADKRRAWYLAMAIEPDWWGEGYECAVHEGKYRGKYSARWVECAHCEFNLATPPGCLCLAAGEDRVPPDLQRRITDRRLKNDACFEPKKQQVAIPQSASPQEDELSHIEEARIKKIFDPNADAPIRDKLGRRWLMCKHCGEVKLSQEMAMYGGVGSCNRGVCSSCYRKGNSFIWEGEIPLSNIARMDILTHTIQSPMLLLTAIG